EHLLLGLVREGKGGGARAIVNLGASLQRVRRAVESIVGYGERPVSGGIGLTPRARRVLALARDEGRLLKRNSVGTEHLLLGMIREGEGVAGRVLKSLGVTLEPARFEAARVASFDGPSRPRMARSAAISGVPGTAGGERVLWEYLLLQTARDEGDGAVRVESVDGEADARFAGDTPIHEALRVLGDDGWELMSVDRAGEVEAPGLYAFKRPKL
ncbi:MAG: hypothetical protein JOZ41_01090, partial [Chloroflexi bacterium]|nr:hypothetical protein [Chloroflexota bacterium]